MHYTVIIALLRRGLITTVNQSCPSSVKHRVHTNIMHHILLKHTTLRRPRYAEFITHLLLLNRVSTRHKKAAEAPCCSKCSISQMHHRTEWFMYFSPKHSVSTRVTTENAHVPHSTNHRVSQRQHGTESWMHLLCLAMCGGCVLFFVAQA